MTDEDFRQFKYETESLIKTASPDWLMEYIRRFYTNRRVTFGPFLSYEDLEDLREQALLQLRSRLCAHGYLEFLSSLPIQSPPTDHE